MPVAVRNLAPNWQLLGAGEARFLGLSLYDARLWVGGDAAAGAVPDAAPYALDLRYQRAFSRERLVSTSVDEMARLGKPDAPTRARWQAALERVFPDVEAGEQIIGLHLPGAGARFWHDGKPLGEVADAEFARLFFAIWLDPRTRAPALRAQLLGLSAGQRKP